MYLRITSILKLAGFPRIYRHFVKCKMMKKISDSWSFVSGDAFEFKESNHYTFHSHENLMAVILPLFVDSLPQRESIAIGLILDDTEAVKVASHMFGLAKETLSAADVQDAKKKHAIF